MYDYDHANNKYVVKEETDAHCSCSTLQLQRPARRRFGGAAARVGLSAEEVQAEHGAAARSTASLPDHPPIFRLVLSLTLPKFILHPTLEGMAVRVDEPRQKCDGPIRGTGGRPNLGDAISRNDDLMIRFEAPIRPQKRGANQGPGSRGFGG